MDEVKLFYQALRTIRRRILKVEEKSAPAVYLFAQTSDNQQSVLDRGRNLWRKGFASSILINDGDDKHGYPGYVPWKEKLLRMGVTEEMIIPIKAGVTDKNVNTLTEAQALVHYVQSQGWKCISVTATPFHQMRAFISTVSVLLREYPELRVYNAVGTPLRWSEKVRHSQGTLTGTRRNFLRMEAQRTYEYFLKGDLVSPNEILAYLEGRDSIRK
jgi:hypothetical protein